MKKYAVLLETVDGVDVGEVTDALAEVRKVPRFEASRRMGGLTGIVEENLDEAVAQNLVSRLRDSGMRSFVVDMAEMIELPPPVEVRSGSITDEFLHLEKGSLSKGMQVWDVRWDKILLLACARVKRKEVISRMTTEQRVTVVPRHVSVRTVPVMKKVSRAKRVNLLDIFSSEPEGLFRVEAESFNFSSLGLYRLKPTHYQNLVQLISVLVERAAGAFIDTSIKFIMDGNPLTNLRTPGLKNYESHVRWALQLGLRKPLNGY